MGRLVIRDGGSGVTTVIITVGEQDLGELSDEKENPKTSVIAYSTFFPRVFWKFAGLVAYVQPPAGPEIFRIT
jgi:hypothetical protein